MNLAGKRSVGSEWSETGRWERAGRRIENSEWRRSESESVTAEEKISFSGRRVSSRHALSHQEDEDGGGTNGATPLENIARR